ncbi:WD40 repeat-like protein [Trichoderma camerunense]
MASPSDMMVDAPKSSEKLLAFTELLREKRQTKAKEDELDTKLQSHERHLKLIRGEREAVEQQMKELEMRQKQLLEEEDHHSSEKHELRMERTEAEKIQADIFKQMLQVQDLRDEFQLDRREEIETLFRESVEDGDAAVVKLLVAEAALDDTWIPLITASSRGDVNTVQQLLLDESEADVTDIIFGRTALSWASAGGHTAVAGLLLDRGVDVNSEDVYGWTPLCWASERGHGDVVRLLLDRGAWIGCGKILRGHDQAIRALAVSPDATLLASVSYHDIIKIWDSSTGECQQTLQNSQQNVKDLGYVWAIVFTHDSKQLVVGSSDFSIKIWNISTSRCQQILQGHTKIIQSLAVSHDSKLIVSGSNDKTIKIWDFVTGECQQTLRGHDDSVGTVIFSHDSKLIASGTPNGHLKIWNTATGECLQALRAGGLELWVNTLAFSHDSKRIAAGVNSNYIKIWDVATGQCQLEMKCSIHDDVALVAFSPDSKLVVSLAWMKAIYIWDSTTGECLKKLHGPDNYITPMAFSKDLKLIASCSPGAIKDGIVKLWDHFSLSYIMPVKEITRKRKLSV